MVRSRKGKKTRKLLAKRSHGRGDTKNRRGGGCRGGKGNAGLGKHRKSYIVNIDKDYFHKHGFGRPNTKEVDKINLYYINQLALLGKLEKKGDKHHFKFDGKILGAGKVTVPLSIEATAWSKNVEKKLKETGGEISKIAA